MVQTDAPLALIRDEFSDSWQQYRLEFLKHLEYIEWGTTMGDVILWRETSNSGWKKITYRNNPKPTEKLVEPHKEETPF